MFKKLYTKNHFYNFINLYKYINYKNETNVNFFIKILHLFFNL